MPTKIDQYSIAVVPLRQMFNDTPLGVATGFIWQRRDQLYLITNWHVVSGRNADTGKALAVQTANRDELQRAFRNGLVIIGYARDEAGNGSFELGRWDEEFKY